MKTVQQVIDFIKTVRPAEEIDQLAISQYCQVTFGSNICFGDTQKQTITFSVFKEWVAITAPEAGSVLVYGEDKIVIVRRVELDKVFCGAILDTSTSQLSYDQHMPLSGFREGSTDEIKQINSCLRDNGMEWSRRYSKVTEIYIPTCGDYVDIFYSDMRYLGTGIFFSGKMAEDDAEIAVLRPEVGEMKYATPTVIGKMCDFSFKTIGMADRRRFDRELAEKYGKTWNGYAMKRLEPVDYRAVQGGLYHYVNDNFKVVSVHDSYARLDDVRVRSGNYFTDIDDAIEFSAYMSQKRREMLARPRKNKNKAESVG